MYDETVEDRNDRVRARNLSANMDFKHLFEEKLFKERKNELVASLAIPKRVYDDEFRETVLMELSHIAYIEYFINNLKEDY